MSSGRIGWVPDGAETMSLRGTSAFDLASTLGSGQAFYWKKKEGLPGFWGTIGEAPCWVDQPSPGQLVFLGPEPLALQEYLGLKHDIGAICASFPEGDLSLERALMFCPGIRLLEQPKWECLVGFLTSSLKQVSQISEIQTKIRESLGDEKTLGEQRVFTFPSPERLAACGEEGLRKFGMGYRAVGVQRAAERIAAGEVDLETMEALGDDELRAALKDFHGVGRKIADCVMLFAYGRRKAFPVDTWIRKALQHFYFPRKRKLLTEKECQDFAAKHFGEEAGYAQQFLFHYARVGKALEVDV